MSGREWKPGDVAFDPTYGVVFVVPYGMGCHPSHEGRGLHTHLGEGDWNGLPDRLRPLVVIDPDDRAQAQRLALAMRDHAPDALADWEVELLGDDRDLIETTDAIQAALREFANPTPPKPDEPTGLGAVVEDADGSLLIRLASSGERPWATEHGVRFTWAEIDPAEILDKGWSA